MPFTEQNKEGKGHYILAGLLVAAALIFAGVTVFQAVNSTQQDVTKAGLDAGTAKALAVQIQRERERNIRSSCEAQNDRHDATVKAVRKAPVLPSIDKGIVISLVDTLAPKRDCEAVVKDQVGR